MTEVVVYPFWIRWYLRVFPYFSLTRCVRDGKEPFWREEPGGGWTRPRTVNILARCGIGDILSFMARLSSVKDRHPNHAIRFFLGGHRRIPLLMRDLLFRDPLVDEVALLNGFEGPSERRKRWVRGDVARLTRARDSVLLDWLDLTPALEYRMDLPYRLQLTREERDFAKGFYEERGLDPRRTVIVQCLTLAGNTSGLELTRFWPREKFRELLGLLSREGWGVVLMGWGEENYGFQEDRKAGMFHAHARRPDGFLRQMSVLEAAAVLSTAGGFIGTNSWTWEVAYRARVPTLCFYFSYQHWIPVHAPEDVRRKARHLHVETDREVGVPEVYRRFKRLRRGS
jgi:hypothetical protein